MDITVVMPVLETRLDGPFQQAIASIQAQTYKPVAVSIVIDEHGHGAAHTRNRALERVRTEYVAFLDDDDEWYPDHLQKLARCARLTDADVVYPYFDSAEDPIGCFGVPFDADLLQTTNYIPVTALCKTEKVRAAGGFQVHPDVNGDPCEDWGLWLAMAAQGCNFVHLPVRTWKWNAGGTKGRPQ